MSQNTTETAGVASQYAAQVTTDLERNTKEQERISGDIAALQEQLVALQHDHSVLLNVQQALGVAAAPVQPAAAPEDASVPAPRKKTAADAGKQPRAKKTPGGAAAKKETSRKSSARTPAGKPADEKSARSTLVELVRRHLSAQSEPRSAAELTEALVQAHPERGIKPTVVRTTVESLVAKGLAHRNKQGSSVFYASTPAAPAQSDKDAAPAAPEVAE
ncbi:hypothetical protein [Streptomyces sp. NPDC020917]|uniref:hypothetical protein n=1 Tax=Streptomyces sp. NPDC020917 TaxID=3365102 RepID=UPI00379C6F5A